MRTPPRRDRRADEEDGADRSQSRRCPSGRLAAPFARGRSLPAHRDPDQTALSQRRQGLQEIVLREAGLLDQAPDRPATVALPRHGRRHPAIGEIPLLEHAGAHGSDHVWNRVWSESSGAQLRRLVQAPHRLQHDLLEMVGGRRGPAGGRWFEAEEPMIPEEDLIHRSLHDEAVDRLQFVGLEAAVKAERLRLAVFTGRTPGAGLTGVAERQKDERLQERIGVLRPGGVAALQAPLVELQLAPLAG